MAAQVKRFRALGEALRNARELSGLSQVEAAARLGMGSTQLSRYETGLRQAPIDMVRAAEGVYEQVILSALPPGGVPREIPYGGGGHGPIAQARPYYKGLLVAAHRLSQLSAELIHEATRGLDTDSSPSSSEAP